MAEPVDVVRDEHMAEVDEAKPSDEAFQNP